MNKRQLKFRAWSFRESKFYTRVLVGDTETDDPCSCVWDDEKKDWANFDKFCGVIQQFTGLYDKNKKPIYEGDIVKFGYTENRDFFGEVVYFEDRATFGVKSKNAGEDFNDLVDYMQFFEVVGNIFELPCNPEVELHDREGYSGPTARLEVCGILKEDLKYLQKYIDYLSNLK